MSLKVISEQQAATDEKRREEMKKKKMANQVHQYSLLLGSRRCGAVVLLHWCWLLLLKLCWAVRGDVVDVVVVNGVRRELISWCRWDVRNGFLTKLNLLSVARGEEADLCRSPNVTFQKSAICRSHNFNYVTRMDCEMSVDFRFVLLDAHDGCAGMSDWAGRWLRISSDARWIADNVTRVAETLIYGRRVEEIKVATQKEWEFEEFPSTSLDCLTSSSDT